MLPTPRNLIHTNTIFCMELFINLLLCIRWVSRHLKSSPSTFKRAIGRKSESLVPERMVPFEIKKRFIRGSYQWTCTVLISVNYYWQPQGNYSCNIQECSVFISYIMLSYWNLVVKELFWKVASLCHWCFLAKFLNVS